MENNKEIAGNFEGDNYGQRLDNTIKAFGYTVPLQFTLDIRIASSGMYKILNTS